MINKDLSIDFVGVHFENPFCLSASPVGNCYEMCARAYRAGWGGITFKTISPDSEKIDEVSPRFNELTKEDTPFVAFNNMEQLSERTVAQNCADMKRLKAEFPTKVLIASIMAASEDDLTELARQVTAAGADIIELSMSCPQTSNAKMGAEVDEDPDLCRQLTEAVKRGSDLPVIAKISPNLSSMVPAVKGCLAGGADGFSLIDTVRSVTDVDLEKNVALPNINGKSAVSGLSGKAVKPIALHFLQELRSAAGLEQLPIAGIGGIETWEDAAEYLLMGATTVQVTTAIMQYGYRIVDDLKNGMMHFMEEKGVDHLSDLVGLANKNVVPTSQLDRDYKVYPKIDWDKCIGCGRCFISCQDGAHQAMGWDDEKRLPTFDKSKCVGCQLCALVCPVHAIKLGLVEMKPGRKGDPDKIDVGSQRLPRYHSVQN
ncbi:NAD-dependent dihydropyrimidine dehydrogenase subunit PreA [Limosilactobacillus oris]|uniref:NAD-dependent dihydropyrimidine dehydrogenase subunit PreA n=1 Tax=Limosilactobacillus oris TaxID=1632 RepID=UPI002235BD3E|nr:NAD-dependent dihydropyrimidine dehydrogenase subunit PreA [Limosilactobacillus oris]MCW4387413.1 NAD-dependent dihydropyrimidine dehydrogenase subunit PreA [Limosilactobacillus oris]